MNTKKSAKHPGYSTDEAAIKKRPVSITISEAALLKMVGLIEAFDGEVGWHGTVKKTGETAFTIEDIYVYPQDASPASVDTHQALYNKWLYTQPDTIFNNMRMHGHSHVNFPVLPSAKDDRHRNGIVEQLVDDMFYIFMIWNKNYKINTMLFDRAAGLLYDNAGINLYAALKGKKRRITDVNVGELKNMLGGDAITAFINEAKNVVEVHGLKTDESVTVRDSGIYGLLNQYVNQKILILPDDSGVLRLVSDKGNKEIMTLTDQETSISITWPIEDVKSLRPDLTDDECMEVLQRVQETHDMSVGVTWNIVEVTAGILFGNPEDSEIMGKFVRNAIAELINGSVCDIPHMGSYSIILGGSAVTCNIELLQEIEAKRLYHHWYGGDVCKITLTMNNKSVSGFIKANGDIRVWLIDKDGNELCNIKDRSNAAGFYELNRYIPDDALLSELLLGNENEQGLSLKVDNHNWWELFTSDENVESAALDGYSFLEALAEAVANMYEALERSGSENEPE